MRFWKIEHKSYLYLKKWINLFFIKTQIQPKDEERKREDKEVVKNKKKIRLTKKEKTSRLIKV